MVINVYYLLFLDAGTIKKLCETELGIVTQCCQPRNASKLSKQYLENVALKINVKVSSVTFLVPVPFVGSMTAIT